MRKQILVQVIFWVCIIAADVLCYLKHWNSSATFATIVKYGVLISSFYFCYTMTYFKLKSQNRLFGLEPTYKIIFLFSACTLSICIHYCLDTFVLEASYGLSIWGYCLNRLWIIGPLLYAVVTLLEKQNGQSWLALLKKEYDTTKKEHEQLQAESQALKKEIEELHVQNEVLRKEIMINNVEKLMSEEYLAMKRAEYDRWMKNVEDFLGRRYDGDDDTDD